MTRLPDNEQLIEATFNTHLAVGAAMNALCVVIHGLGLFTLQRAMLSESARQRLDQLEALSLRGTMITLLTVFALIFVHFIEIWLFAFLYDFLGALPTFQESLYFSTISYATIGYSDAAIVKQWRMVAALEGILGVILLGWSTAFFVRVLSRIEGDPRRTKSDPPADS